VPDTASPKVLLSRHGFDQRDRPGHVRRRTGYSDDDESSRGGPRPHP